MSPRDLGVGEGQRLGAAALAVPFSALDTTSTSSWVEPAATSRRERDCACHRVRRTLGSESAGHSFDDDGRVDWTHAANHPWSRSAT